jgi:beta-glucosidase
MAGRVLGPLGVTALLGALLVLAVAGCASRAPVARAADAPVLTVATLNLYHDRDDWPRRRGPIVQALAALQPDVIALQEVLQHEALPNQAMDLAEALGYRAHFVSTDAPGQARRYGNAILTRLPVIARGEHALEPHADSRTVASVRVRTPGGAVTVLATHLHAGEFGGATRAVQVRDLLRQVDAGAHAGPFLLVGDFNAVAGSDELAPLQRDFFDTYGSVHRDADTDTARHATLNPAYFERPVRIDHVYAQRGRFEVEHATRILDRPDPSGAWPSDHFGVLVGLRLSPAQ